MYLFFNMSIGMHLDLKYQYPSTRSFLLWHEMRRALLAEQTWLNLAQCAF